MLPLLLLVNDSTIDVSKEGVGATDKVETLVNPSVVVGVGVIV